MSKRVVWEPLDTPDGPGWWAWEGYFDFGEDDTDPTDIVQRLCEVKEKMVWAFIANGTAHRIESMIGKWIRVYMPWEAQ